MKKKHRMMVELIAQEETLLGGVDLSTISDLLEKVWSVAKKYKFDAYIKWYPKKVIDYKPTWKTYLIKTVEDIAKLTPNQFEMFIDDLRNFCLLMQDVELLNRMGIKTETNSWMTWIDDWFHLSEAKITTKVSNKL